MIRFIYFTFIAVVICVLPVHSDIRLPHLLGSNMVIQRDVPIHVWGRAPSGTHIRVSFAESATGTVSTSDGTWETYLPAQSAGGPFTLSIEGDEQHILTNILVGDVWLCSGQSNMEWPLSKAMNGENEVSHANVDNVRLFSCMNAPSPSPLSDATGIWDICTAQTAADFSAVGYFFGTQLSEELDIPIGLIDNAWGGTPARAWTSPEKMWEASELVSIMTAYTNELATYSEDTEQYKTKEQLWEQEVDTLLADRSAASDGWACADTGNIEWHGMTLPCMWKLSSNDFDGAVWFIKHIVIPQEKALQDMVVRLGPIDDFDQTYFNGKLIGSIGKETPDFYQHPRVYTIPASHVHAGTNILAVRIVDQWRGGGFATTRYDDFTVSTADGTWSSALSGEWKYRIEHELSNRKPIIPYGPYHPSKAGSLYHGRVAPLFPFPIVGVIWYQGESDASRSEQYKTLFPTLIESWREGWDNDNLPFLFVQLANFSTGNDPDGDKWALQRAAQRCALELPHTAMAVAIDAGESRDIHPRNKQIVADRLTRAALSTVYDRDIEYRSPSVSQISISNDIVIVTFQNTGKGLFNIPLKGFEIKDSEGIVYPADAWVSSEDTVTVWSRYVAHPAGVRYAWKNDPVCTLYSHNGLPAVPFCTNLTEVITY